MWLWAHTAVFECWVWLQALSLKGILLTALAILKEIGLHNEKHFVWKYLLEGKRAVKI